MTMYKITSVLLAILIGITLFRWVTTRPISGVLLVVAIGMIQVAWWRFRRPDVPFWSSPGILSIIAGRVRAGADEIQ